MTLTIADFQLESLADPGHLPQEFLPSSIKSQQLYVILQMNFFLSLP